MCRRKSVSFFAHDPAHRLLPSAGDADGVEFTCGGCLIAGAGPRYRCATPGCGFTIHEACALRFPRSLKSALHPHHRLRRRQGSSSSSADAATAATHGVAGEGGCDVCGEDVKGACYGCTTCGVVLHPLCARMPGVARGAAGGAHPADHEVWLVRAASSSTTAPAARRSRWRRSARRAGGRWERGGTGAGRVVARSSTRGASCRRRSSAAAVKVKGRSPW
ncbi:unnamed protein product [Urochloa humidicola]